MMKLPIPLPGINQRRKGIAGGLFIFLLLYLPGLPGWAAQQTVAPRFTVSFDHSSLVEVFDYLGQHSDFTFVYNAETVKNSPVKVTKNFHDASLTDVLDASLVNSSFEYEMMGNSVVVRQRSQTVKEYVVKGKVLGAKDEPLPGVTIRVEGTTIGVASDVNGNFSLRLPMEKGNLSFSFVGYKSQRVAFNAVKPLTVRMEEEVAALDEVQVRAYGSQKKRTMVSAISSVKAEEMKELPTHSLESLLQGHMAGVEVNNVSGAPGGGGSIVAIRGYNSFFVEGEGDDRKYGTPLYVIDGVPMQAFTSPITGSNTLSDIDPSMIESIEVLKDAASAAIYGSRAGNGVILITTKKGRDGQMNFTANVSYSASWLPETPEVTGGNGMRRYSINGLRNSVAPYLDEDGNWKFPTSHGEVFDYGTENPNPPMYDWFWGSPGARHNAPILQDSLNPFYNNSTDWWRYAYRTASVYNANLQANGGNDKARYMIGAGYYKEEGIMLNSDFQRINVLTNVSVHPSPKIRLDNQISLTYSDRSKGGSTGGKIEGLTVSPQRESSLNPGSEYINSEMIQDLNNVEEKNHSYSARYNLLLDYEIIRNLHLKISGGVDFNQQNQNTFRSSTLDKSYHRSETMGDIGRSLSILNENLLDYTFSIKQKHNFNILLGLSFQKDQNYSNKGGAQKGPNDFVHYAQGEWGDGDGLLNNETNPALDPQYISAFIYKSGFTEERMNSYFGRLSYNYKERYMFEATVRRDGSSVFGDQVRWATFPSFAAGWAFSEENFMKSLYWLSFGKIRASWGQSGQKFSQPYLAHGLMASGGGSFLGEPGMAPETSGGVINRKLSWEKTDQYDIGLDVSFLDYRLKFTLDYYYRYTKGQLQKIDLPSGGMYYHKDQWQNALAVSNEGLELELTADIFRETAVKWRMKLNASRNWNRFEKSAEDRDFGGNVIGKSLYQIKAYKTQGFYNKMSEVPISYGNYGSRPLTGGSNITGIFFPGTRRMVDLNGDGRITDEDKYYAASPLPVAHGGFINEIRWKQLDLNIFFTYSLGRHILKSYDDTSIAPNEDGYSYMGDLSKINAWENADSKNPDYPILMKYTYLGEQYTGMYDCDIENVHMIRLKQLTLGYNLHEKIARKIGVGGARVFLTMENLFLLTNYSGLDPEIVDIMSGVDILNSYPLPRKFTVGLTVNF